MDVTIPNELRDTPSRRHEPARSPSRGARAPAVCARAVLTLGGAALVAAAALATGPAALAAAGGASARSVSWNAAVGSLDLRNDTAELSGDVRVWQGPTSIEAQAAIGRQLSSDDSRWTFTDSVHIRTAQADLRSSSASASFVDGQIAQARVEGSPAHFEQRGVEPGRQVQGRAGIIEYDFSKGIVRLSNEVWFSNGRDEFRGDLVVYDVHDERVQINPGSAAPGRVQGIIRPRETEPAPPRPQAGAPEPALDGPAAPAPSERAQLPAPAAAPHASQLEHAQLASESGA